MKIVNIRVFDKIDRIRKTIVVYAKTKQSAIKHFNDVYSLMDVLEINVEELKLPYIHAEIRG